MDAQCERGHEKNGLHAKMLDNIKRNKLHSALTPNNFGT